MDTLRDRLSFLPFLRERGPSVPERRAMRDYLIQANAIIARVLPARKTWLVELNRLVVLVQEDKVPTANREAGETFRTFSRTYTELRDAVNAFNVARGRIRERYRMGSARPATT